MTVNQWAIAIICAVVGGFFVFRYFAALRRKQIDDEFDTRESEKVERTSLQAHEPFWNEILDVSPFASASEIRKAYKQMMFRYHPDRVEHLGPELKAKAERKSKQITEAYRRAMQGQSTTD